MSETLATEITESKYSYENTVKIENHELIIHLEKA